MMKYKKYIGSAEVSIEDNILHGKLLHIKDLVTYEANSPEDLEKAFHEAVDCYIEDCHADGVEPDVPFKGSFNVRVSPETHRSLGVSAHTRGCSLNEYVKSVLEIHESVKNTSSTATHYHFNFEGSIKEPSVVHRLQNLSVKPGGSIKYYIANPNRDHASKAAKCH